MWLHLCCRIAAEEAAAAAAAEALKKRLIIEDPPPVVVIRHSRHTAKCRVETRNPRNPNGPPQVQQKEMTWSSVQVCEKEPVRGADLSKVLVHYLTEAEPNFAIAHLSSTSHTQNYLGASSPVRSVPPGGWIVGLVLFVHMCTGMCNCSLEVDEYLVCVRLDRQSSWSGTAVVTMPAPSSWRLVSQTTS